MCILLAVTPTVHLVDASPYIFRAYFSLPDSITDPGGRPVNAVHGFVGFLLKLIDDETPTHLAVAFDESLTTSFRNEIYPEYKAQREAPPAELKAQLQDCRDVAVALGAATFAHPRYEADDLIATLRERVRADDCDVVVVSGDKDLAQLVDEKTTFFDFAKGLRYRAAEVEAKFGVRPDQIVDLLALMGDSVDNIPGVKGVGQKSAVALLGRFGSLSSLYERLDKVEDLPLRGAKSLRRKLDVGRDSAILSWRLADAARDIDIDADLESLRFRGADRASIDALFERLGFDTLAGRIRRWA